MGWPFSSRVLLNEIKFSQRKEQNRIMISHLCSEQQLDWPHGFICSKKKASMNFISLVTLRGDLWFRKIWVKNLFPNWTSFGSSIKRALNSFIYPVTYLDVRKVKNHRWKLLLIVLFWKKREGTFFFYSSWLPFLLVTCTFKKLHTRHHLFVVFQ